MMMEQNLISPRKVCAVMSVKLQSPFGTDEHN